MRFTTSFLALVLLCPAAARAATTWTVCASGCDFTSIQVAVWSATAGDTIDVQAGTYAEHVDVPKTLDIQGAGKDLTTLDVSAASQTGFSVSAADVVITGFEITGNPGAGAGVNLTNTASGCTISDNRIENFSNGVYLYKSSQNDIFGNEFLNNNYGVKLAGTLNPPPAVGSDSNTIEGNTFEDHAVFAIDVSHGSSNNTIADNDILGGWVGILVASPGAGNEIRGNAIGGTSATGISTDSTGNTFVDNLIDAITVVSAGTAGANTWNLPKTPGTNIVGGSFLAGNAYLDEAYFAYNCPDADGDQLCDVTYTHDYPPLPENVDALPLKMLLQPSDSLDWGDAPSPYPTLYGDGGAGHFVYPGGPYLGLGVDVEPDGQPHSMAQGDDTDLEGDDEDGIQWLTPLIKGHSAMVRVTASAPGELRAWVDFDFDGVWEDIPELVLQPTLAAGDNDLTFAVPASAVHGGTLARFRFCSSCLMGAGGIAPDGEVEDYLVGISANVVDCGDAPDPPYPTLAASGGAAHLQLGNTIYLGGSVDSEPAGIPTPDADGDDTDNIDDEEGAVLVHDMVAGFDSELDIISSAAGVLQAWVDFNDDGDWADPGEAAIDEPITAGLNTISFAVPPSATPGSVFARLRVSSTGGLPVGGVAGDGEVEDYKGEVYASLPDHLIIENETVDQRHVFRANLTILVIASDLDPPATATLCAADRVAFGEGVRVHTGAGLVVRLTNPANC